MTGFAAMKISMIRRFIAVAILVAGLAGASPAAACFRQVEIAFEPGTTRVVNPASLADFVQISTYGSRQKLDLRVAAPEHALAVRRVNALLNMLEAQGLDRGWIRTRASRGDEDRAVVLYWPGPIAVAANDGAAPPRPACGG